MRARTFAIGISSDISRCELNRTAYRGRTDANAPKKDAGFVLYDPTDPPVLRGDVRLPHIDPAPETAGTAVPTDESGPSLPASSGAEPLRPGPDARGQPGLRLLRERRPGALRRLPRDRARLGERRLHDERARLGSGRRPRKHGHPDLGDVSALGGPHQGEGHDEPARHRRPLGRGRRPDERRRSRGSRRPRQPAALHVGSGDRRPDRDHRGQRRDDRRPLRRLRNHAAGLAELAPAVIDFMRGNDGTETSSAQLAAGSVHQLDARDRGPRADIISRPGTSQIHKPFEATYATRRTLAWMGADDGFLHAFDFDDGTEVLGLLPPNLIANQVTLYNNFLDPDPQVSTDTGQNAGFTVRRAHLGRRELPAVRGRLVRRADERLQDGRIPHRGTGRRPRRRDRHHAPLPGTCWQAGRARSGLARGPELRPSPARMPGSRWTCSGRRTPRTTRASSAPGACPRSRTTRSRRAR